MATQINGVLYAGGLDFSDQGEYLAAHLNSWRDVIMATSSLYTLLQDDKYEKIIQINDSLYLKIAAYSSDQSTLYDGSSTKFYVNILYSTNSAFDSPILLAQGDSEDGAFANKGIYDNNSRALYMRVYAITVNNGDTIFCMNNGNISVNGRQILTSWPRPIFSILHGRSTYLDDERKIIVSWSRRINGYNAKGNTNAARHASLGCETEDRRSAFTPARLLAPDVEKNVSLVDITMDWIPDNYGNRTDMMTGAMYANSVSLDDGRQQLTKLDPIWSPYSTYVTTYAKLIAFTPYRFDGPFIFGNQHYYALNGVALLDE